MVTCPGRGDEGPPDPDAVALVAAVLPVLGPGERWVVRALPGPHEPPGPGAPRGHRDRWWFEHVSAVGGVLLLTDPTSDPAAVRWAVELVAVCAGARDRGATDPSEIARDLPRSVSAAAVPGALPVGGPGATAVDAMRSASLLFRA